jgi:hypothetical protein
MIEEKSVQGHATTAASSRVRLTIVIAAILCAILVWWPCSPAKIPALAGMDVTITESSEEELVRVARLQFFLAIRLFFSRFSPTLQHGAMYVLTLCNRPYTACNVNGRGYTYNIAVAFADRK